MLFIYPPHGGFDGIFTLSGKFPPPCVHRKYRHFGVNISSNPPRCGTRSRVYTVNDNYTTFSVISLETTQFDTVTMRTRYPVNRVLIVPIATTFSTRPQVSLVIKSIQTLRDFAFSELLQLWNRIWRTLHIDVYGLVMSLSLNITCGLTLVAGVRRW